MRAFKDGMKRILNTAFKDRGNGSFSDGGVKVGGSMIHDVVPWKGYQVVS